MHLFFTFFSIEYSPSLTHMYASKAITEAGEFGMFHFALNYVGRFSGKVERVPEVRNISPCLKFRQ